MTRVHILTDGFTSPNGVAFLFPLYKFQNDIRALGYKISYFKEINDQLSDCDILCVDSKFFKPYWKGNHQKTLEDIATLKRGNKLFWFDQADSSGNLLGQVLPYVDRYYKAQILNDLKLYQKELYGGRLYTDYYHRSYNLNDDGTYLKNTVQNDSDLEKIGVSWNSGLMNYGWISPYLTRLLKYCPAKPLMQFSRRHISPEAQRPLDVSCRMGITHSRETIAFHRRTIKEKLTNYVQADKISRAKYLNEIARSKICTSPFGYGEITLKDFETFLLGSTLLKPDMSHMQTWPHFFEDQKTCLFHDWDMNNLLDKIEWALENEDERVTIAKQAQKRFLDHTVSKDAGPRFASRFNALMTQTEPHS